MQKDKIFLENKGMATKEQLIENFYLGMVVPLINMWCRCADREDIIMLTFKYDNFPEFFDELSPMFLFLPYSSVKKKVAGIIRLYVTLQVRNSLCQYHHTWNIDEVGNFGEVEDVIFQCIENHQDDILNEVKEKHYEIYKKICDSLEVDYEQE